MSPTDRHLMWLHGEVKTPPIGAAARVSLGLFLRQLQKGEALSMPHSRPMPDIGPRCHELRVQDDGVIWRLMYRADPDAVLVLEVFQKTTRTTPRDIIAACQRRLSTYDAATE